MRTQIQTEWCVYRVSLTTFLTPAVDLQTTGRVSGLTDVYTILFLKCAECQVVFFFLFFFLLQSCLKSEIDQCTVIGKRLALDVNFTALIQ